MVGTREEGSKRRMSWSDRPVLKSGPLIMATVAALYSVLRYSDLPEQIPVHLGLEGLGNALDRAVGAFLIPGIVFVLGIIAVQVDRTLRAQPRIQKVHLAVVNGFALLLTLFHFLALNSRPDTPAASPFSFSAIPNPFGSGIESAFAFFVLLGLLLIVIGLPLAVSLVPPNQWYGARTKRTLDNRAEWYRVNRGTGILFTAVGGILIAAAAVLYFAANLSPTSYTYICMGVAVGGVLAAAVVGEWGGDVTNDTD